MFRILLGKAIRLVVHHAVQQIKDLVAVLLVADTLARELNEQPSELQRGIEHLFIFLHVALLVLSVQHPVYLRLNVEAEL